MTRDQNGFGLCTVPNKGSVEGLGCFGSSSNVYRCKNDVKNLKRLALAKISPAQIRLP